MKVQTISRSQSNTTQRECIGDLHRDARNLDPKYHPMQRAREYTRAVTSAKLSRMFAKPLIGNLGNGHLDAVNCTCISRKSLSPLLSGGHDGQVKLWDLPTRTNVATLSNHHSRSITGVVFGTNNDEFYTCAQDGFIKKWSIQQVLQQQDGINNNDGNIASDSTIISPVDTWRINGYFQSIDHDWTESQFVTASDSAVQLWTPERSTPLQTHSDLWGSTDTVHVVRYNPASTNILAHCSKDRGIGLHDLRTATPLRKTILQMKSNTLEWNPMEPLNFVVGNEDYSAYLFDMRKLHTPTKIYKGHVMAIMSLSWSPTGREFVSGSYDRTIRIFQTTKSTARDVYHTKRMQRVLSVNYTLDNKYIISGSDDTNIRLWKAQSNEQVGKQLTTREESAQNYRQALLQKYQHVPQVKRIVNKRRLPKTIQKQTAQLTIQKESARRKQHNKMKHSKPGTVQYESEVKKVVVKEID